MRITMVGTGYVGLTTGACLANLGNDVICLDIDEKKIAMLNKGEMPIYEPGLKELVLRNVEEGRLRFTTETKYAIESSDIVLVAWDLQKVLQSIKLSRQTLKTIKQNLFWAFIYNSIWIPLAVFWVLNPIFASFAMSMSSVSVISNSLRLKFFK